MNAARGIESLFEERLMLIVKDKCNGRMRLLLIQTFRASPRKVRYPIDEVPKTTPL
jgi:hypothetical protein